MTQVVANFDCEALWGGAKKLPAHVREALARRAPALAVLGGPVVDVPTDASFIAWGETPALAALRGTPPPSARDLSAPVFGVLNQEWRTRLPELFPCPDAAKRGNDKRWAWELAGTEGWQLEGSALVSSLDEMDAAIRALPPEQTWVAKAPFSASGRERVRRHGPLDGEHRVRVERLLAHHGTLVFEPWVKRLADYGVCGLIDDSEWRILPPHKQRLDRAGVFEGIEPTEEPLPELVEAAELAGTALAAIGYRGPFSVDGYRHETGFQRISEINARASFGLVAHFATSQGTAT